MEGSRGGAPQRSLAGPCSSFTQSLGSPQLKDGISRREDQLPGGVPSLAVRYFRSCKAGVQAYDGSLAPKADFFSSFFFFSMGLRSESLGVEQLHLEKEYMVLTSMGTVQAVL